MSYDLLRRIYLIVAAALLVPAPAFASNDALLKLLQILRDRGSITAEEYDDIRRVADEPVPIVAPSSTPAVPAYPPARPAIDDQFQRSRASAGFQTVSFAPNATPAVEPTASDQTAKPQADVPAKPPAKPERAWYEKLTLRGYTQFRYSGVDEGEGPPLEVPADRSVNETESFVIRRGRLVLSGDVTDWLSLYVQSDLFASTGAPDFSLQLRDLYVDFALNTAKTLRLRLGQSKVPFGWVNMQSSQNRAPLERPEAINTAAESERDLGAFLMWASPAARQRFRDITAQGLKGSGDYGVVSVGAYAGQGPNRSDQNGEPHVLARVSYPFKLDSGQFFELGAQAYSGRFVPTQQAITVNGVQITPDRPADGITDQRFGATAIWYPQPIGIEAEWNVGRGPQLSDDLRTIDRRSLNGGYVQFNYRQVNSFATWFPFVRWNYFDGARKFARNAPKMRVNEVDFGLELAKWAELETTIVYSRTIDRTRTGAFPYSLSKDVNRIAFQVQWNY